MMAFPKKVRCFKHLLLLSLLPGVCLSLMLFFNAIYHDIQQYNYRNSLPNTDLSLVRIEGLTIDDNKPYICKRYPTWDLTVDGIPIPNYEAALEVFSAAHNKIQGTRPLQPYSVFLDRPNNIELRFSYDYMGRVEQVSMMRIDTRSTLEFLLQRKSVPYEAIGLPFGAAADSAYEDAVTDYGHSYGQNFFPIWIRVR